MKNREAIEMMQRASDEIKSLRSQIANLKPRAEAFDAVQTILGLTCQNSQGYGEDWAWKLDKRAKELQAELDAEKAPAADDGGAA